MLPVRKARGGVRRGGRPGYAAASDVQDVCAAVQVGHFDGALWDGPCGFERKAGEVVDQICVDERE